MSDPLRWWPGKYPECKRIAQLVDEILPSGEVLEYGGIPIFPELLPEHHVTNERLVPGGEIPCLPYDDEHFDIGISARVLELLPPRMREPYLRELLRVTRYRAFVAIQLQPELEVIDKIKNTYLWDTSRIWNHPGVKPAELERLLAGRDVCVEIHAEPGRVLEAVPLSETQEVLDSLVSLPVLSTELLPGLITPPFLIAEIVMREMSHFPVDACAVVH